MLSTMSKNTAKSSFAPPSGSSFDERDAAPDEALTLPSFVPGSGTLDRLVDTARDYARAGGVG